MLEVDLENERIREIDLNKVDEIRCQKCGEKVKGRMGCDVYTTEYDVHRYTKILLCPSCKKELNSWASPKLAEYEKALVMQWFSGNLEKENTTADKRAMLLKHIIDTHDCFLCKSLGWKEKCEQAKKSCDDFFIPELERIFVQQST